MSTVNTPAKKKGSTVATSKLQVVETDPFGTERFEQLKIQITAFELNKDARRRLEKIESVFTYRRGTQQQLQHAEDCYPNYEARSIQQRLDEFKPIQFFLDAMQTLLDDIVKEEAAKPVKPVRRLAHYLRAGRKGF